MLSPPYGFRRSAAVCLGMQSMRVSLRFLCAVEAGRVKWHYIRMRPWWLCGGVFLGEVSYLDMITGYY